MIKLVVETGEGLATANTYADLDYVKNYAANHGVDLGADDEKIKAQLIVAAEYLDSTGPFKGQVLNLQQGREFPRKGLTVRGQAFDGLPEKVKQAQSQLVLDIREAGNLFTTKPKFALKSRTMEGMQQVWAVGVNPVYEPTAKHEMFDFLMTEFVQSPGKQAWTYR